MATSASPGPVMAAVGAEGSLDSMGVRAIAPVSRSVPPTTTKAMAITVGRNEGTPNPGKCHLQRTRTARIPRCLGTAGLYQTCIIHAQPLLMPHIPSLVHQGTTKTPRRHPPDGRATVVGMRDDGGVG